MEQIKIKAYGKINLGLDVIRKRKDGYHDIDMIMQTVGVYDDIEIKKRESQGIVVKTDVIDLPNDKDNLAYMAAEILIDEFNIEGGVEIRINKRIPIAGGMAGGSTDCAATLKGINQLFELGLSENELQARGVRLGADVPYCIMGGTASARGIGEILTPLPAPPQCHVLIAKPGISVSTQHVYSNIRPEEIEKHPDIEGMICAIKSGDLYRMSELLENVMEKVTIPKYPVINDIKQTMLNCGALNSIMSGSGPTVFGLFDDLKKASQAMSELEKNQLTDQLYLTEFVN